MEIFHPVAQSPVPEGHVRLRTAGPSVQFKGEIVATSSSDVATKTAKPKWTELELYRKTDGSGEYVLHVIARSVTYHAVNGCDNGVRVKLADLAQHYLDINCEEPMPEPCQVCHPLDIEDEIPVGMEVSAEVDWHTVYACHTVDELLTNLRQTKGPKKDQFGMPALILLDRARRVDPVIAQALDEVRSI
jgi:hypothetical protein